MHLATEMFSLGSLYQTFSTPFATRELILFKRHQPSISNVHLHERFTVTAIMREKMKVGVVSYERDDNKNIEKKR